LEIDFSAKNLRLRNESNGNAVSRYVTACSLVSVLKL